MLEVANLAARYGMHSALRGVSLRVGPGEVVSVLGANGAGKSTLLKVLAGLVKPFGFERLGLSPLMVGELFKALARVREAGVSVLIVEQNAKRSLQLSHRGYLLEQGAIVGEGSAADLLRSEAVRKAYLGS